MVTVARPTFDVALARAVAEEVEARLSTAGAQVVGPGSRLVMDAAGAEEAEGLLAAETADLLLILQATFADSTMALRFARAAQRRGTSILLWAVPEGRDGGRLRLNSLCGINLAGHALSLHRIPYDYLLAAADDPEAHARLLVAARAGRGRRLLRGARVGVVGEHPAGFETCAFDAGDLGQLFGVEVDPIALGSVLEAARSAKDSERERFLGRVEALAPNLAEMDSVAVRGTAGVHAALAAEVDERALQGVAVRCWPEFFTELGCAACGAMSLLGEDGVPTSCEADVNGTVTSLLLQAVSSGPAFIADLVSIDRESNTGVLWHCGLAPVSMADPATGVRATIHSNRKLPLLFEFALKPGRVTLARLHRSSLQGGAQGYTLLVGGGEMLQAPRSFGGTNGVVRFDQPAADVLDVIMRNGVEHHLCMVYGDYRAELEMVAAASGLPIIRLT